MCTIVKREIKNYLKNPIYWIGLMFIIFELYQILNPYLKIKHFDNEQELLALEAGSFLDNDIMEGYVPSTKEERLELAYEYFAQRIIKAFDISEEEMKYIIEQVKNSNQSLEKQSDLLMNEIWSQYEDTYNGEPVYDLLYCYELSQIHKADMEEANAYIDASLEKHSFSWYFSRKYADFCGLFMGFFSAILLAFLFIRDTKKDIYELLHTKPITAKKYILGKVGGAFCSMLIFWGILTLFFGVLCEIYGRNHGFPTNHFDFLVTAVIYVIPNILMITCIYIITALIFKNPLPAVPAIFLYIIYSNMGERNAEGVFGYYGRPLAIMVRFPGRFFETTLPAYVNKNQIFLLITSLILVAIAVMIWRRRRVY